MKLSHVSYLAFLLAVQACGSESEGERWSTRYVDPPAVVEPPRFDGDCVAVGSPLYRVVMVKGGDLSSRVVVEGGLAGLAAGMRSHPEVSVSVRSRVNGDDTMWEIDATPAEGYGVFEVEFPIVELKRISGPTADRLIVSWQSGVVIDNPFESIQETGSPHHFGQSIWYGSYGSTRQALQCVIYENGRDGVMLWTQDGSGRIKDFDVSKAADGVVRASVHHYPDGMGKVGASWRSSYPVLTSRYHGGWQEAAVKYRSWAVRQPWCAGGGVMARVKAGELPEWYARSPFWLIAINETSSALLERYAELFPGVEFSVFLTQWQRWPFDCANPDYFPPKNEEGYRNLLAMQKKGMHFYPYMNMNLMDVTWDHGTHNKDLLKLVSSFAVPCPAPLLSPEVAAKVPAYARYEEYWGTDAEKTEEIKAELRASWGGGVNESLLEKIRGDWFTSYPYEKNAIANRLRDGWGKDGALINGVRVKRTFKPFCRAAAPWRECFVDMATRNLEVYGADGQYLDQSSESALWACWSEGHGHAPGINAEYLRGSRQIMNAIRARNPRKPLCGEAMSEYLIGALEDGHCQFPEFFRHAQVPLFQSVYHGHVSCMAWGLNKPAFDSMSDLAAALSLMLHFGYKIGFAALGPYQELISEKRSGDALPFVRQMAKTMLATMDSFCYGERLADPVVRGSRWHEVTYYHDGTGAKTSKAVRPLVEGSCWRSLGEPKKTLLLLTNSGDSAQKVTVVTQEIVKGAALTDLDGMTVVYSTEESITVPPFSIRAFVAQQ